MILKKFIGKTIEAAKKSAQQMYGDDLLITGSVPARDGKQAGITIAVSEKHEKNGKSNLSSSNSKAGKTPINGVHFESSEHTKQIGTRYEPSPVSPNLRALRRYAEQLDRGNSYQEIEKNIHTDLSAAKISKNEAGISDNSKQKNGISANQMYSRANIRHSEKEIKQPENSVSSKNGRSLLAQFDQSRPKFIESAPSAVSTERREKREVTALHKRFDKIEALLDSALISSNINYVSHTAFQQLIHAGISTTVVSGWFSDVVKQGIDPFEQTETFMSKLSAIIREALTFPVSKDVKKYQLFSGPSGSGKTQLIMKLMMHPDFMQNKKTAVAVFLPREKQNQHYYTILEPFCRDHDIPYFGISGGDEVTTLQKQWDEFEHILIDTPSISIQQEGSFREYWKIRQVFASLTPLEVHYVVNASLNRFYFRDSSAIHHPLHPDYIAITHLDEVSQWGPMIPFLKEMACGVRYISSGNSVPDSLSEFNPAWFAQRVLQNT